MKYLLLLLFFQPSFELCDSVPPDVAEGMCGSEITGKYTNQHVNGCIVGPYVILDNVTSDSLWITAKDVQIIGGSFGMLSIKMLNCN